MFNIGDKVKVTEGVSGSSRKYDGKISTITKVTASVYSGATDNFYYHIALENPRNSGGGIWESELTLVEPKKEVKVRTKKLNPPVEKLTRDEIIGQDSNKRMLNVAIENDMPVLLIGETGTGKTTLIREQAQTHNADWLRFNLTGETTVDEFVGKYELEGGQTIWRDGILLQAMKLGKWLIVDEINVALPEILFVLHSLLDDDKFVVVSSHNGEIVKPHKDFRFFATMNPCDEYAGTKELNKAFQSRFNMILELEYPDKKIETRIVKDKADISLPDAVQIADVAIALREAKKADKIYYTCSTRDLIYWGNLIKAGLSLEDAFKVSVLNKAQSDKPEIRDIYHAITSKYIDMETRAGEKLTIDIIEDKFNELEKARADFEARKDKVREEITKEIVTQLTSKSDKIESTF